MTLFYVCIGGSIGALVRYLMTVLITKKLSNFGSYTATLVINVMGSFLLGVILGLLNEPASNTLTTGITIGIIGAFTTYSTFSLDCVRLIRENKWKLFFLYSTSMILLTTCSFLFSYLLLK
ncbi:fluoride efflux transporter FluC [Bacillus sp. AK128]